MDPYLWKRLWRKPGLSICSLILSSVLCFVLMYLSGYQDRQQQELDQIKTTYDILCVVTDRKGTASTGLRQKDDAVRFVLDHSENGLASHIRDLRMTKEYTYSASLEGLFGGMLIGITSEACDDRMNSAMGAQATCLADNFYTQGSYQCIIPESAYLQLGSERTIELYIQDPYIDKKHYAFYGTGTVAFEVVGWYSGSSDAVFISFETAQQLADQISGGNRSFDSMSFYAADNQQLDELRDAASSVFAQVDPRQSWPKLALTIHDEQYRATVAALEQNIERSAYLLPVILLLSLGVGFLVSFLATRGERRTYALMRTLGMTRGKLFASILREQMFLTLLAALAAPLITKRLQPALWYLLCHGIGCCIAVIRSVRVAPTAILREQE